jgi:hypothetical protein
MWSGIEEPGALAKLHRRLSLLGGNCRGVLRAPATPVATVQRPTSPNGVSFHSFCSFRSFCTTPQKGINLPAANRLAPFGA